MGMATRRPLFFGSSNRPSLSARARNRRTGPLSVPCAIILLQLRHRKPTVENAKAAEPPRVGPDKHAIASSSAYTASPGIMNCGRGHGIFVIITWVRPIVLVASYFLGSQGYHSSRSIRIVTE